jgi:hypothetical protein
MLSTVLLLDVVAARGLFLRELFMENQRIKVLSN